MAFAMGFAGAGVFALLFGGGIWLGWTLRGAWKPERRSRAEPPDERERRRMEAFRKLQNYSTEDAYGLTEADALFRGGEGR